jgi:sugar phosphate isomerase/epimerase
MKLSCLPVSFFPDIIAGRMTLAQWAHLGADLGLDAVDVSILFFPDRAPAALAQARRAVEDEGMALTMMSTYPDFTHPDPAERQRELERARETLDVAARLGVQYVRATAGQAHPATPRVEGIAWAIEGLRQLVESARGSGVTVVYENHGKPGVWQYADFSAPPDIFMAIYNATADVGLTLNFDTGNASVYTPDPVAFLDSVIARVNTIHAADAQIVNGEFRPVVIGTGPTPFVSLFRRLRRAGWDNWVCIEEAGRQGRKGVEVAVRFIRRAWDEAGK